MAPGKHHQQKFSPALSPIALDISESPAKYVVSADLPGITPANVSVRLKGENLTIEATRDEKRQHKTGDAAANTDGKHLKDSASDISHVVHRYHRVERFHGTVSRSFMLPRDVDTPAITSTLSNGVLTLVLPRITAAATELLIPVNVSAIVHSAADIASDPVKLISHLSHHITPPNDNPRLVHARVEAAVKTHAPLHHANEDAANVSIQSK
jgi:HSP20 family molecular chaperone IbpA